MFTRKKACWLIVIIVLLMPPMEFLREYVVYRIDKYKLNAAAQRLRYNMTRDEVTQIMGVPDAIFETNRAIVNARIYVDIWNWKSAKNQGFLWLQFGLSKYTSPLEVTAYFDDEEIFFAIIENN